MGSALLISTYEMGRQPFGLASAAAWLRAGGWTVACVDAAKQTLHVDMFSGPELIAFHLPMHTATRLAAPLVTAARASECGGAHLRVRLVCAAQRRVAARPRRRRDLRRRVRRGARRVGKERSRHEPQMPAPRSALIAAADSFPGAGSVAGCRRSRSTPPCRCRTASGGCVGYTEASRGCRHLCRHCPIVPVYGGQFRVVQPRRRARRHRRAGGGRRAAHHLRRSRLLQRADARDARSSSALHERHPRRQLRRHDQGRAPAEAPRAACRGCAATGCAFVTSAVESVDDDVLRLFEKGHTRADFVEAVALCRDAGVTLVPTFVAFHPWLTLAATASCSRLSTPSTWSITSRRSSWLSACWFRRVRGCWSSTRCARHLGAFDRGDADAPLGASRSAGRRAAARRDGSWSARG